MCRLGSKRPGLCTPLILDCLTGLDVPQRSCAELKREEVGVALHSTRKRQSEKYLVPPRTPINGGIFHSIDGADPATNERARGVWRIFQQVSLVSGLFLDTRDVILATTLATRYKKIRF